MDEREYAGIDVPVARMTEDNRVCLNEAKWDAHWWWQAVQAVDSSTQLVAWPFTLAANGFQRATVDVTASGSEKGDFEITRFLATAPPKDVAVIPYNQTDNLEYSNKPIPSRLIFGASASAPGIVAEPIYVSAPGQFVFKCTNLIGSSASCQFAVFGRRFFGRAGQEARFAAFRARKRMPYWLAPDTASSFSIAASGTQTVTLTVPNWGVFQALAFLDDSTSTSAARPKMTVTITDPRTREVLMDQAMPWLDFIAATLVTGGGANAELLTAASFDGPCGLISHLFEKYNQISLKFTSTDTGTITLRMGIRGIIHKIEADNCPPDGSDEMRARFVASGSQA